MLCELIFEQPGLAHLMLIDVALTLFAIQSIDPNYQFHYHNCWWYSQSALLLLMCLSQPNAKVTVVEDQFITVALFPAIMIPGGLNNTIIICDASLAHTNFTQLVSLYILGAALNLILLYPTKQTEVNAKLASHLDLVNRAACTSAAEAAAEAQHVAAEEVQHVATAEAELQQVAESHLAELMRLQPL
jgi:hypothetical protein